MSPAFIRASYAMVPIGLAGVVIGAYDAVSGSPIPGVLVAVVGAAAAALAVAKLRSISRWPFG